MSLGSNRQADHTNRIVLTVLGLGAVAAAAAGLTLSYLTSTADQSPITISQRSWLLDHGTPLAVLGLVVTLGLTVASLIWLRHQFRPIPERRDLTLARTDTGATILATAALTSVIETELIDLPGVTAATARVSERDPNTVDVVVDIDDSAQLPRIAKEAGTLVLERARRATNRPELGLQLECRPMAAATTARVA